MKKLLALALIAGMFMPLLTGAQEKKGKSPEEAFAALDSNNDKKLSKDEFLARTQDDKKDKRGQVFDRWDKDGDKFLSLDEFKAGMEMTKKK
jgi:hypothetical protein